MIIFKSALAIAAIILAALPPSITAQVAAAVALDSLLNTPDPPPDGSIHASTESMAAYLAIADNTLIVTYSSEAVLAAVTAHVNEQMEKGKEVSVKATSQFKRPQKLNMPLRDDANANNTSDDGRVKRSRAPNRYAQTSDRESTILGYVVITTEPETTDQEIDTLFGIEGVISVERDVVYMALDASSRRDVTSAMDPVRETIDVFPNKHVSFLFYVFAP